MIRHTSLAVAAAVAMLIAAHGLAAAQAPVATNAPRSGRVNTAAPVFLLPDATRVPLKTLTEGTMVRVEREQGDWVQVTFNDAQLGRRTGWMEAKFLTMDAPEPPAPREVTPPPPTQARRTPPPPVRRRPPPPSIRAFGTYGFDTMSASDSFKAVTGSDHIHSFGGGVQGVNLWRGLFAEVSIERSTVDGERAFVYNEEVFPLGIPLKIEMMPLDMVGGWRVGVAGKHPYATYAGGGLTYVSYKETSDFAIEGDNVDERKFGFVGLFGFEYSASKWIHLRAEMRYRRITDILGLGGVSDALDENDLGGFGGGFKVAFGR